jgi:hypothetical protein
VVVTGLEFQDVDHTTDAALDTVQGCIDLRMGVHTWPDVERPEG